MPSCPCGADGPVRMEIIVVDDGSTDTTSDVARAHGVTSVRHETNRGLAAARNSGVRAASAPIVAFLDDDCEPEPQWARQLLDDGHTARRSSESGAPRYRRRHEASYPGILTAITRSIRWRSTLRGVTGYRTVSSSISGGNGPHSSGMASAMSTHSLVRTCRSAARH